MQAFYTSIMDVGGHGHVSLGDAATWFGIEFDESTGHAHSALADARVTAKLLKQMMDGDYHVSPHAQEIRQRWGISWACGLRRAFLASTPSWVTCC